MAAGDGLISMTPTSIAYSGTSASINTDGGVDFSAVTSLSLNGVFTGDYDNYLIALISTPSTTASIGMRFRASGVDDTSAQTDQYISANNTTINAGRDTAATSMNVNFGDNTGPSGVHVHVYGPYLSEATVCRKLMASNRLGSFIEDYVFTHSVTTSWDGFTLLTGGASFTGNVHVFGYEE